VSLASTEKFAPTLSQSPLWSDLLDRVEAQISGRRRIKGSGPSSLQGMASAVARAHSQLLAALESGPSIGENAISQLATEAVELMLAVAGVWATLATGAEDRRGALVDLLRRRLGSHEDAVLAGEVTYCVWSEQAEEPGVRMRQAIARLSRDASSSVGDLLSLRIAAVDLASLLIQSAASAAASGRAGEAPDAPPAALSEKLSTVTAELAARAQQVERPVAARADIVAHHLAACLRVRVSQPTLQALSVVSPDQRTESAAADGLRDAWLRLAANEYVVVAALDAQLNEPTYRERFGSLSAAIAEGATNVICGARLSARPAAFRHRRAWGHQSVALTYALEAYVAGLRGHAPSLAQAQLITLTRLVRATAALTLIDMHRAAVARGSAP
jgi:hypothetical protein